MTATVTSTVTAFPKKKAPPERSVPPPAPSTSSSLSAEATVIAYFDAINDQDHRAAWELGGKNLAGDYRAFVDGLAGTERDTVRILGVEGNTVRAELEAPDRRQSEGLRGELYRSLRCDLSGRCA
ncbi:hypothetical protein ACFY9Q_16915 [Streptomyces sp. NPDC012389]|uniref:hypothetical protein n=1 Tax=Streptomyces sp. NPDC012389 TaxID=3364830 RepID=UPI0036F0E6BA